MRNLILISVILFITLTNSYTQINDHDALEHLYRNKPTYEVKFSTHLKEFDFPDSKVLIGVPKGSKVIVINSYFKERWEVLYQGERGWIEENKISFYKPGLRNKREISILDSLYRNQPFYYVKNKTTLKEHMSHKSATLVNVPKGVKVKVINSLFQDWWEVLYDNRRGNLQEILLSDQEIDLTQLKDIIRRKPLDQSKTVIESKTKPRIDLKNQEIKCSKKIVRKTSLRENPNSKSQVILRLQVDSKVYVLDDSRSWWAKVKYQEKVGWVKKSYLKK